MDARRARPVGGRFTEWTEGKAIVASDVLDPATYPERRVITNPLPVPIPAPEHVPSSRPVAREPAQEVASAASAPAGGGGEGPDAFDHAPTLGRGTLRILAAAPAHDPDAPPDTARAPFDGPAPAAPRSDVVGRLASEESSAVGRETLRIVTAPFPEPAPAPVLEPAPAWTPAPQAARATPTPAPGALANEPRPASASPSSKRRGASIKEHPVADHLLSSLSSYERPFLVEETPHTSGQPAAAYVAGPYVPAPGLQMPPHEPKTRLADSVEEDIGARRPRVTEKGSAQQRAARNAPTLVTRKGPLGWGTQRAPRADEAAGLPRQPSRTMAIAVALLALLGVVAVGGRVLNRDAAPIPVHTSAGEAPRHEATRVLPLPPAVPDEEPREILPPPRDPADNAPTPPSVPSSPRADALAPLRRVAASAAAAPEPSPTTEPSPLAEPSPTNSLPLRSTLRIQN